VHKDGGIHRVGYPGDSVAISVHLYELHHFDEHLPENLNDHQAGCPLDLPFRCRDSQVARRDGYRATLCSVTKVMSSSCSHLSPVKE
jgi:hypothetical protein